MSTEYEANVILGIRFSMGEGVVARRVVHSCDHEERIGRRFCSECGVKVWQRTEWDEDAEDRLVSKIGDALPTNFRLLRHDGAKGQPYFLGYGLTASSYGSGFLPVVEPAWVNIKIAEILRKVEIREHQLDDVEFGLHAWVSSY